MFEVLVEIQRAIRDTLAGHIEAFAAEGNWNTLLAMLPLGIVFGIAHAMTPGHSKSVLASFVLGSSASVGRAAMTSLLLAATHIASAVVLALVANELVTRTLVGAGRAPALEYVSRITLAAIGLWLVIRALRNDRHFHGEGAAFGVLAGLVPCPLTLFVMTLALARGVIAAGLVFAFTMFIGVALTLLAIAVSLAWGRRYLAEWMGRHGARAHAFSRLLEGAAGVALMILAASELA